ncbi:uncharacterized protein LOC111356103 [Spodoptera litura]|uniref:Uncharacterized protein LOC111356103 n=1 Tax=Spodoptera litura TaxID=69820 RepID=A0A9J7ECD8_SPOLT|nr:uncharacterized protein LOC111356103 [Spodoptera litura]
MLLLTSAFYTMDIVADIQDLYKDNKWREIVARYHDHPERNKVLWVYPSEGNFSFVENCLAELGCDRIVSIGCGSGLLEWMITQATGVPVSGIEVDGAWWSCKYAPPNFIPLHITPTEMDKETISIVQRNKNAALLFCYFNNRKAFDDYLKYYDGNVLIIIGPHEKAVHTDPKPFDDVTDIWTLYKFQEIRNSGDFIVVYKKQNV